MHSVINSHRKYWKYTLDYSLSDNEAQSQMRWPHCFSSHWLSSSLWGLRTVSKSLKQLPGIWVMQALPLLSITRAQRIWCIAIKQDTLHYHKTFSKRLNSRVITMFYYVKKNVTWRPCHHRIMLDLGLMKFWSLGLK